MPLTALALGSTGPVAGPPPARPPAGAGFEARLAAHHETSSGAPAQRAPLEALLRGAEAAQARLDQLLAATRGGRALSAGDLLVLQAEAYRFSQGLEVAGKVVEQGVQAVKQAIQTPL
jgi:hypothetical protein